MLYEDGGFGNIIREMRSKPMAAEVLPRDLLSWRRSLEAEPQALNDSHTATQNHEWCHAGSPNT